MRYLKSYYRMAKYDGIGVANRAVKNLIRYSYKRKFDDTGYMAVDIQGHRMLLDLSADGLSRDLVTKTVREKWTTPAVKEIIDPGMAVLDIGANIGYYTLIMAREVGPDGTVAAFEPFPNNFELLEKNVRENGYESRVDPYQVAISDTDGEEELVVSRKNNLHSISRESEDLTETIIGISK